jgi:hypothetical protein
MLIEYIISRKNHRVKLSPQLQSEIEAKPDRSTIMNETLVSHAAHHPIKAKAHSFVRLEWFTPTDRQNSINSSLKIVPSISDTADLRFSTVISMRFVAPPFDDVLKTA